MTGNFLSKQLIEMDLTRFAFMLRSHIQDSEIDVYERVVSEPMRLSRMGFKIHIPKYGHEYNVYMMYEFNEVDEYAILEKKWIVDDMQNIVEDGFPTLQEVIDYINGKREEQHKRSKYSSLFHRVVKIDGQLQEVINGLDKDEDKEVVEKLMNVYKAFLDAEEVIVKTGGIK